MRHVPGVDEQRIQPRPACGKGIRQCLLPADIACIGVDHPGLIAQQTLRLGTGFRVAPGDGHLRPFGEKELRRRQANAAGAAGDQRVFIS